MIVNTYLPSTGVPPEHTAQSSLGELTSRGVSRRYGGALSPYLADRVAYELSVIESHGAADYMLVVAEYITWAKGRGIWASPGRGSTAGSVVAYALGITEVDPIRYGLLFERFLTTDLLTAPDIDVDVEWARRHEVVEHLVDTYGATSVAGIATFAADRHAHAAGLLIADRPVSQLVPVEPMPRSASTEWLRAVALVSTLDYVENTERGLPKFDILGLTHLDSLSRTVNAIEANRGITIRPWSDDVPLDDAATLELLGTGDAADLFQLGGGEMRRLLRDLQPERFADLVAMIALYRPSPMSRFMHERFIENRHGRFGSPPVHPDLDADLAPILDDSRGLLIYQEQAIEVVHLFAGRSMDQAESFRRDMCRQDTEVRKGCLAELVADVEDAGYSAEAADALSGWLSDLVPSAFNKAHAVSYALITYWEAFMKTHFPVEFRSASEYRL